MGDELYISAEEAAAELGVAVSTLYAYVGRKKIRSKKVPGERHRRYWRPDIERVKKKPAGGVASLPGAHQTQISLLTPAGHYYRGVSALQLAETHTLEQTAALLWEIDPGQAFGSRALRSIPAFRTIAYEVMADSPTPDKAIALFPLLELANPQAFDLSHGGLCRTGADILRWYAALLTGADEAGAEPLHLQVAASAGLGGDETDLLRRLLVLSADHGFAAGTAAVRAVASTGVSPYRSVISGLSIVTGRRSRSGRLEGIGRFLAELLNTSDPARSVIVQRLRDGENVPGFDAPEMYPHGDPRAQALLEVMRTIYKRDAGFRKVLDAVAIVQEINGGQPSFALVHGVISKQFGLKSTQVLYVLGRCAGWIAHAIEQYRAGEAPRAPEDYIGTLPADPL